MGGPLLTSGTTPPEACPGAECPICLAKYDKVARELFLRDCCRHPLQVAQASAWYKPAALAQDIGWMAGTQKMPPHLDMFNCGEVNNEYATMVTALDRGHLRLTPWRPVVLLPVLLAGLLCGFGSAGKGRSAIAAAMLAAGSLVPPLLCVPSPHYIAEPFLGLAVAVSLLVLAIVYPLARGAGLLLAPRSSASPPAGHPIAA